MFNLPVIVASVASFWVLSAAWSIEVTGQVKLINHSEYCSINDSVIRNKVNRNELFTIINNTEDWLIATNDITKFVIPATNISDCEDDVYNPDIVIYAVQTSIYAINFLLATCTIALHLYFKEMRTVFGVLITIFCFFLNVDHIVTFVHNKYQFTNKVNDGEICATFIYMRTILTFLFHTTKFTILFHFTYLMYNSYRMRSDSSGKRFDKKLMSKYITFFVSLTTIYTVVVVPYDLAVTRTAFDTKDGYCAINFLDDGTSVIIFIVQLSMIFVIELTTFGIGILFYFLVSKRFCEFKSSDIRVCFILVSTAGLNTLFFLVSYSLSGGSSGITFVASSIGTFIEQSVLLIIFLTSKKVKSAISSMVSSSTQ